MTPEERILETYKRHNVPLTVQWFTHGGWAANSQYGYPLEWFDKQADAEKFVFGYYKDRMNLIDQ